MIFSYEQLSHIGKYQNRLKTDQSLSHLTPSLSPGSSARSCALLRSNGLRGDMLGDKGTNGAAEGDDLLSAMAIGSQSIVPIDLLSEMAQWYSSFSRDLAQPIPDQGL